jgi:hypothetical protein
VGETQEIAFKLSIALKEGIERRLNVEKGEKVLLNRPLLVEFFLGDLDEVWSSENSMLQRVSHSSYSPPTPPQDVRSEHPHN